MGEKTSMYLNNEQYLDLLKMIKETLNSGIDPMISSSDTIGNKYTASSCGLCNDNFTTIDNAMFPEEFEKNGRKSIKYRMKNHPCPFDDRIRTGKNLKGYLMGLDGGCYYTCCLRKRGNTKEQLLEYVEDTERRFKEGSFDNFILGNE